MVSHSSFVRWVAAVGAAAMVAAACSSQPKQDPTAIDAPVPPCNTVPSGADLAGAGPGGILHSEDITSTYDSSEDFPKNARAWRVQYVSTGVDETDLEPVCGIVVAPDDESKLFKDAAGNGRMFAWSHGTIGLAPVCEPSAHPDALIWPEIPGGIGAVSWGMKETLNFHLGAPENGVLQYMIDNGYVVSVTDLSQGPTTKGLEPYVVGKVEGANVLDMARSAAQVVETQYANYGASRYKMVIGGHSQGGHAAFFAAQLADKYLKATRPVAQTASLDLVGVYMVAPASNFIIQKDKQPDLEFGDGLADLDMHLTMDPLVIRLGPVQTQIGPLLFSYIFGSWVEFAQRPGPTAESQFPAYPPGGAPLDLSAVATPEGVDTINQVAPLCVGLEPEKILAIVSKYADAATNKLLTPEMWNLPSDYQPGQYFKGGMDKTCATTTDAAIERWCDWIRFNIPGPYGTNPFDKVPRIDGKLVPSYIAQGTYDDIVFCRNPAGHPDTEPPPASTCTARAFYDSLESVEYCPDGAANGYLQMDVWRNIAFQDPSDHMAIAGQASSFAQTMEPKSDLRFEGSKIQQFVSGAFEETLASGCNIAVVNQEKQ